jgi:hypothetical protein
MMHSFFRAFAFARSCSVSSDSAMPDFDNARGYGQGDRANERRAKAPVLSQARRSQGQASDPGIVSHLIVLFPDLSFGVRWSQQIMHYLGVCFSICMSGNI